MSGEPGILFGVTIHSDDTETEPQSGLVIDGSQAVREAAPCEPPPASHGMSVTSVTDVIAAMSLHDNSPGVHKGLH